MEGADGMNDKRTKPEPPLYLEMDFGEALARFTQAKPKEVEEFNDAYAIARLEAVKETKLDLEMFPETPPFTMTQAKDEAWLPE